MVRSKMEPMFSQLKAVPFQQYSRAGEWLSQTLKERRERFWTVVEALLGEWRQKGTLGREQCWSERPAAVLFRARPRPRFVDS